MSKYIKLIVVGVIIGAIWILGYADKIYLAVRNFIK